MVPGSLQFVEGFYIGYKLLNDETTSSGPKKSYSFKTIDVTKEHLTKTDFEVILNDLFRNSRYNIIIQAFNKKGPGPSSDDVIATTSEFGTCNLFIYSSSLFTLPKLCQNTQTVGKCVFWGYIIINLCVYAFSATVNFS